MRVACLQGGLAEGGDSGDPCILSLRRLGGSKWAKIPHPHVLLDESFPKQDQAGSGRGGFVRLRAWCR